MEFSGPMAKTLSDEGRQTQNVVPWLSLLCLPRGA